MGLAFPFGFWVDNAPTLNKFALTDCSNPEIVLYTNTDLGEYTDGSIINYEGNCFNVESLEEFPPGAEVIEIGDIERVYPPEDEPPGCDCCQNGDTYQITDCEGTVVGVVNLTDLEITTGNVVKIEENENCFIVGEKVCTPADLVFFEQVPCLEDPTECCNECGEEPPAENFSYTVCGSPEIAFVSEIQLHEEGAQSIWFNCQWYGIGETTPLGPGPITPLVEEVVSSLLPCEAAQETQQVLKWVKCDTEEEFIYTDCCELPEENNYTPGVTTTNNFLLPEPSADCYTFVGPAQLPEDVETVGCPEFVIPLNCGEEPCTEDPGIVITPEMFVEPEETGSNMTVGVNAGEALNIPYAEGQLGAFFDLNGDGILQCVGLATILSEFFAVPLWGNNPDTPEKDGLDNGDVPIFAILYEEQVYLFEPLPPFSGYVTDGIVIIADGSASPLV